MKPEEKTSILNIIGITLGHFLSFPIEMDGAIPNLSCVVFSLKTLLRKLTSYSSSWDCLKPKAASNCSEISALHPTSSVG